MSSFKKLLAGAFALALTTAAYADSTTATIVRITGSTAYRGATNNAITHIFDSGSLTYAYVGGSLSSAGTAIFHGTIGGPTNEVIIETGFTGSAGGIQLVGQSVPTNFITVTYADTAGHLTAGGAGSVTTTGNLTAYVADIAMSDTYQNASPFNPSAPSPYTTTQLTETPVGIVPFKWVASRGNTVITTNADSVTGSNILSNVTTTGLAVGMSVSNGAGNTSLPTSPLLKITAVGANTVTLSANVTAAGQTGASTIFAGSPVNNITPQLAQAVFTSGFAELALFTGNPADIGTKVYAIGRDADSGTRLTAFAETGIGVTTSVQQYTPVAFGGVVSSQALSAALAVNTIPYGQGNGGYTTGGLLAAAMGNTTASVSTNGGTAAPILYVTYLSTGDATTAINAGAKEISYNGSFFSNAAVQQGSYTFWSYEHLMYLPALANDANKLNVATTLANQILNTDATLLISTMKVGRAQDGGLVTQKYN